MTFESGILRIGCTIEIEHKSNYGYDFVMGHGAWFCVDNIEPNELEFPGIGVSIISFETGEQFWIQLNGDPDIEIVRVYEHIAAGDNHSIVT